MRKIVILTLFVVSAAGWGHTQDMPPEVKAFLDNYTKDSTADWGPLYAKGRGAFDNSVQIKDLKTRAIEVYTIKRNISFDAFPDTISFSEIIQSIGYWRVVVTAHNKPLYELLLAVEKTEPRFVSAAFSGLGISFTCPMWDPLLKVYPESTGINPVFVTTVLSKGFFGLGDHFLYFKQKGPREIYYIRQGFRNEQLEALFPASVSIETLDDSKKLVGYWKKEALKRKEAIGDEPVELKKTNSVSENKTAEPQQGSSQAIIRRGSLKENLNSNNIDEIFEKPKGALLMGGEK